jgi:hypothetical protein
MNDLQQTRSSISCRSKLVYKHCNSKVTLCVRCCSRSFDVRPIKTKLLYIVRYLSLNVFHARQRLKSALKEACSGNSRMLSVSQHDNTKQYIKFYFRTADDYVIKPQRQPLHGLADALSAGCIKTDKQTRGT